MQLQRFVLLSLFFLIASCSASCGTKGCGTVRAVNSDTHTCTDCGCTPAIGADGRCWSCWGTSSDKVYAYKCINSESHEVCQAVPCGTRERLNDAAGQIAWNAWWLIFFYCMGAIGGLWCFVWSVRQLILGCIDSCAKHPDTQQSMAFSHQTVHEIETTSLPANGMQELNDAARQAAMQQEQHVHASTPQLQDVTKPSYVS